MQGAMNPQRPTYCKQCGAALPSEGQFCESCGAPVEDESIGTPPPPPPPPKPAAPAAPSGPAGKLEDFADRRELPDASVPPRLGRALSKGWDLLADDFFGAILMAFIYLMVVGLITSAIPLVNAVAPVLLGIGFLAWAEERRRGLRTNVGTLFRVPVDQIGDGLMLALVFLVIGFAVAIPMVIAYFSAIGAIITSVLAGISSQESPGLFPFIALPAGVLGAIVVMLIWFVIIVGPVVNSFIIMSSWAIAKGVSFNDAINWAWERIKTHFASWWLAGLVLNIISGIGVVLCYIGILVTAPWAYLAWAEIVGDMGDETSAPRPAE